MNTDRVNEIVATMKSFSKEKYQKSELLSEMFTLQQEIVDLTFNGDNVSTEGLKIWDVERHLEQLNRDCGNVADDELKRFKHGGGMLINLIKAEVSGNRGEYKAFSKLDTLRTDHIILKNIELKDEDQRSELDAVVIAPNGITIVEVKNTSKDIFIDEDGNYFRTGAFLNWDCQIAHKMDLREQLLRKALKCTEIEDIVINKIVVFTNYRIEVHNKCESIKTCFVSQLPHIIEGFSSATQLSREEMENIELLIKNAECRESYPVGFEVEQYKTDFATVIAVLEEAKGKIEEQVVKEEINDGSEAKTIIKPFKTKFRSKYLRFAGGAVAGLAVSMLSAMVAGFLRK